jgi:hypothetical protein
MPDIDISIVVTLYNEEESVGEFVADIIVNGSIIFELKSLDGLLKSTRYN